LARLDRKRPKKGSNEEWEHPHDPDARITKMKDGRTKLGHKAEHAVDVDMETGAVVAVTVQPANAGDTQTLSETLAQASEHITLIAEAIQEETGAAVVEPEGPAELVTDKGYHSREVVKDLTEAEIRTYISEPERGRQRWEGQETEQSAVYGNRRRVRGERGKRLQRQRGEKVERVMAHLYETGGMRRLHLRGHSNIVKRLLIHACGLNLGLLMRSLYGVGTPRGLQNGNIEQARTALFLFLCLVRYEIIEDQRTETSASQETPNRHPCICSSSGMSFLKRLTSASGC
jgi:transposase